MPRRWYGPTKGTECASRCPALRLPVPALNGDETACHQVRAGHAAVIRNADAVEDGSGATEERHQVGGAVDTRNAGAFDVDRHHLPKRAIDAARCRHRDGGRARTSPVHLEVDVQEDQLPDPVVVAAARGPGGAAGA